MKRIIKWVTVVVFLLLILIVSLILVLPHVIDFNKYKGQIEEGIYRASGYEVHLEGDLDLFFIPWVGIDAGQAKVANPPGFDSDYLASLEALQLRLRLWPLIWGEIEMQQVVFQGLHLDLIINEQGQPNWLAPEPKQADSGQITLAEAREQNPEPVETGQFSLPDLDIAGLEISDSSIFFRNLAADQMIGITDLNLYSGRIAAGEPIDLQTALNFKSSDPELEGGLDLNTSVFFSQKQDRVQLSDLALMLDLEGEPLPEPIKDGQFQGNVLYALQENRLEVSDLSMQALGADIRGKLSGMDLDELPRIVFDLQGDNLDLDRFLPENESEAGVSNPGNNPGSNPQDEHIDLSFLHELALDGAIKLTNLKASGALLDEVQAEIVSGDGELEIPRLQARLYEGSLEGRLNLKDQDGQAQVQTRQSLQGVQVGPLLRDAANQDLLSGRLDLDADLDTFGNDPELFLENLSGQASVDVQDGIIKGIDLDNMVRSGFALAFGDSGPSEEEETTEFSTLRGSFDIDSGIAKSDDLQLSSPVLGVTGDLLLDLPESYLESRARIFVEGTLKQELERRYSVPDQALPLRLEGKFDDLRVRLDVEDALRETLQKKGKDMLQQLLNGKDSEQDKPESSLEERGRELLDRIFQ